MSDSKYVHIFVSGKVQGVGFRWFCKNLAESIDITGWVRNLDDGRVEIMAMGDEDMIRIFFENVNKGNSYSEVENCEIEWIESDENYDKFEII